MKLKLKYRLALLEGHIPAIGYKDIKAQFGKKNADITMEMLDSAWNVYLAKGIDKEGLTKGSISTKTFAQRIADIVIANKILIALSNLGWIVVYSKNNWSDISIRHSHLLKYITAEEAIQVRAFNKYKKYKLSNKPATKDNLVRINGKTRTTSTAKRTGFMKAGNTEFMFDTHAMWKHKEVIVSEVNKGMSKVRLDHEDMTMDQASYDEIAKAIVDDIMYNPDNIYRPGQSVSDSRLRDIAGYTNKIFNPVSYKVARACLVIPPHLRNTATIRGLKNMYLFIAELAGTFEEGTKEDKIQNGRDHYFRRTLLDLDYSKEEDRKEAFENIWLERVYEDVDKFLKLNKGFKKKRALQDYIKGTLTYKETVAIIEGSVKEGFKWSVPIEVDMSASVLGYVGALTNHKPFLERCNMVGKTLREAWKFKGLTKKQAKVIMQKIYGSAQGTKDIWRANKIKFTKEQIAIFDALLETGELAVGDKFSKFIINNCNPQEKMTLHIGDEFIDVECNKYFHVGETVEQLDLYDTENNTINRIVHHSVAKVPNLEAFRRFFVTALIHNRDGWNEDRTCEAVYDKWSWILPVHDASIVCPESADDTRAVYAEGCEIIRRDRASIMTNYCTSIGVPASTIKQYKEEVQAFVTPLRGKFKCNTMVLK